MLLLKRLMERVEKDPLTNCWNFTGYKDRGYGQIRFNGRIYLTHVIAFTHLIGRPLLEKKFTISVKIRDVAILST